jgi:hypothetical protein
LALNDELRRGEQARQLLQNELYQEAVTQVRQAIIDKWISAPLRDREGQHELKIMLKLLGDVTGYIQTAFETGKLAQIQLEGERRMDKLKEAGL